MAEYEERSLEDLTEEPSQHRLEQLRSQGQVAQSRELTSAIALFGVVMTIYFLSGNFVNEYSSLLKEVFTKDLSRPLEVYDWRSFYDIGSRCAHIFALAFFPIAFAGAALGLLSSIAQVGFIFTTETLSPDFKRVDPISGFMRLFSMKSIVEGLKALAKFAVVAGMVYMAVKSELLVLPNTSTLNAGQLVHYIGATATRVFGVVVGLLIVLAGVDYWIQWRRFRNQAMTTKAEAKQELKEREGDPQIKARIRSIQRDAARKRMMKSVPKADVIITNPTHIAIAIRYNPDESFAPKVVAKGADYLAEKIKNIAREHGIPTIENKPLARTLYKYVKVGQMIPRSLYQAVAEILAYVYKLKGRKFGSGDKTATSSKNVNS